MIDFELMEELQMQGYTAREIRMMMRDQDRLRLRPSVPCTQDLDARMAYAHYTDDRFKEAQVVYGRKEKDLSWDYSDRFYGWDYQKAKAAAEYAVSQGSHGRTARFSLLFLQYFFDDPNLELVCVMTGFNVSNGYDYYVYGYRRGKTAQ